MSLGPIADKIAEKIKPTIENPKTVKLLKAMIDYWATDDSSLTQGDDDMYGENMENLMINHFKFEEKDGIVWIEGWWNSD